MLETGMRHAGFFQPFIQPVCDVHSQVLLSWPASDLLLSEVRTFANMSAEEFEIEYFHERVLREIESWPVDLLAEYARLVELVACHGPALGLPHSRALGLGLFELRPRGKFGTGRAVYCFQLGRRVVILHAFIKKTQQTPEHELKLARKRLKELRNG